MDHIVQAQHDGMLSSTKEELRLGLRRTAEALHGKLLVGTACSGSDLIVLVMEALTRHWRRTYGVRLEVAHVFACESVQWKCDWIGRHFKPQCVYNDIRNLKASAHLE